MACRRNFSQSTPHESMDEEGSLVYHFRVGSLKAIMNNFDIALSSSSMKLLPLGSP